MIETIENVRKNADDKLLLFGFAEDILSDVQVADLQMRLGSNQSLVDLLGDEQLRAFHESIVELQQQESQPTDLDHAEISLLKASLEHFRLVIETALGSGEDA